MSNDLDGVAPRHIRAQAAVWVTDLHGPDRDARMEERVRRWIAADPWHAVAFEAATEAWQSTGNLPAQLPDAPMAQMARDTRSVVPLTRAAIAGVAVLGFAFSTALYWLRDDSLSTGPGEQKTVDLADGSQVMLNANTRLRVRYDDRVRQVSLLNGEALFRVAKHQPSPFVVLIGTRKVIAVGTAFEVRREGSDVSSFSVTLVEGRVAIEPTSWSNQLPPAATTGVTVLEPGERLRISSSAVDLLDQPPLDKVTAWEHGQLIFEDASLRDAAAEFNRYSKLKLIVAPDVPESLRVGGVFKIGDPATFARAMGNAYQLRIVSHSQSITLMADDHGSR